MKISYVPLDGQRRRKTCKATITCDHSASSYGIPVVVLKDGSVIDGFSWALSGCKVISATPQELAALQRMIGAYAYLES